MNVPADQQGPGEAEGNAGESAVGIAAVRTTDPLPDPPRVPPEEEASGVRDPVTVESGPSDGSADVLLVPGGSRAVHGRARGASAAPHGTAAAVTSVGRPERRHPLRMIIALAWCGLIAAAGTTAGAVLIAQAALMNEPITLFAPVIVLLGIILLVPAVLLWAALKRLWQRPPSGMWLAVGALCCYAAAALTPLLLNREPHSFWRLVQWFGLPGCALLGSVALVVWAVRTTTPSRR